MILTRWKFVINSLMIVIILVSLATISGCHRSYYRRQADAEVNRLVAEKTLDPRWNSIKGDIEIDSRSRMYDPFSKDHPPIPTDDPASHKLMRQVDGKPGYPHWHANGDISEVENPLWKSYLPINERGEVQLSLERAYQLALLHSPDLQSQYETLYESALDVSLERFGFDSQLFAGFNSFFTTQGRLAPGGSQSNLSFALGDNSQGIQLQRMGITGANFAVGLANTILFNFAGNNTQTANTILDFSLVQPLLQNAGRSQILEALTQSERTLLANVRQLERFKRGFYLQIAIGRTPGAGPNLAGNFLVTPGSGGINAGGFLGLLEQQQQIRNQEFNIRQLETVLKQFEEYNKSGLLDAVQLKLFQSSFYLQQRTLLDAKTSYQTSLDEFKSLLGLPPDLEVVIEDEFLDRFNLISDEINDRLITISDLRQRAGDQLSELDSVIEAYRNPGFEWPADFNQRLTKLVSEIEAAKEIIQAIRTEDFAQLNQDFERLEQKRKGRTEYLQKLTEDVAQGRIPSSISSDLFKPETISDPEKLRELLSKKAKPDGDDKEDAILEQPSILTRLGLLEEALEDTKRRLKGFSKVRKTLEGKALYDYLVLNYQQTIPGQLSELNNISLDLSLLQAQARTNSIEIVNSDLASEHAIRIARCLRRDWMNARASLVDQYRNIEFVADQLESGIDLVFNGSLSNDGNNPFRIRTETGELQAGLQFDAPIVRQSERNAYRTALIDYQQSKRSFYEFEDSVKGDLRELVRNLGRNRVRFELDRRSVQVQIENVEINRLELDRPITATNTSLGTTTARNLTDAIIGLNNAQNSYLSTWVQYEVLRRNLDFDMGTMQLDSLGQWIDPGPIDDQIGIRALAMMGAQPDCQFCEDIATAYDQAVESKALDSAVQQSELQIETEAGELEVPEELDRQNPPSENIEPAIENVEPPIPTRPRPEPVDPTPELRKSELELLQPNTSPSATLREVPVTEAPAIVGGRLLQIRVEPIEPALPIDLQPIPSPVSSSQPQAISKAVKNQTAQPNSSTQPITDPLPTPESLPTLGGLPNLKMLPPIDGIASWSAEGSFNPAIRQAAGILPENDSQNSSFRASVIPSEAPQSERLVYALPPMNTTAGLALLAPIAEKQSVDAMPPAETEPATNLKTQESTEALVPITTGFGGLLNRFQSK